MNAQEYADLNKNIAQSRRMGSHLWWIIAWTLLALCALGMIGCSNHNRPSTSIQDMTADEPVPKLRWLAVSASLDDQSGLRGYWIGVENWYDFPVGIFMDPAAAYSCAGYPYTSRVVVQVRSSESDYPLAFFCDLLHPRQLSQLEFYISHTMKPEVYLFIWDTLTGENWITNHISLPRKAP